MYRRTVIGITVLGIAFILIRASLAQQNAPEPVDALQTAIVLPDIDDEPSAALARIASLAPVLVNIELIRPPGRSGPFDKVRLALPAGTYSMGSLLLEAGKRIRGFGWKTEGQAIVLILRENENARDVLENGIKSPGRFSGTFDNLISWLFRTRQDLGLGFFIASAAPLKSSMKIQMDIAQDSSFRSILTKAGEKAGLRWIATVPDKPSEIAYLAKDETGMLVKQPGSTTGYIVRFNLFPWQGKMPTQ